MTSAFSAIVVLRHIMVWTRVGRRNVLSARRIYGISYLLKLLIDNTTGCIILARTHL